MQHTPAAFGIWKTKHADEELFNNTARPCSPFILGQQSPLRRAKDDTSLFFCFINMCQAQVSL